MNKVLIIIISCFIISFIIITVLAKLLMGKYGYYRKNSLPMYIGSILILGLILCAIAQVTGITKETFLTEFHGPKFCKGGAYLFQGDSAESKYCRSFYESPEGLKQVCNYNCGKDQHNGYPIKHFEYTPLSNSQWKNERCDTPIDDTNIENNGVF
jgi:hypothetical protein